MPSQPVSVWIIVQSIASAVAAAGVIILIAQALLLLRQLRDTRRWNKMQMAFRYLPPDHELNDLEIKLNNPPVRLIDRAEPLSGDEMKSILSDDQNAARVQLKNYLNLLESYATAVNYGIADADVAKALYGSKLRRHLMELRPFVDHFRAIGAPEYICELEQLIKDWYGTTPDKKKY